MSTKKQRRREQRQREEEQGTGRRKMSGATLFMVSIAAVMVVVGLVAYFLGDAGNPPFPGAVWSPEHQHWH